MPVEDVFTITGRGTVATGRVERGMAKVGDEVEIIGLTDERKKTVITGLEMFRKVLTLLRLATTSVLCSVVSRERKSSVDRFSQSRAPFIRTRSSAARFTS